MPKLLQALACAIVTTIASAEQMFDLAEELANATRGEPVTSETTKSFFGAIVEEHSWEDLVKKTITFPAEPYHKDYEQQHEFISNLTKTLRAQKQNMVDPNYTSQPIYTCQDRDQEGAVPSDPFEFLPVFAAEITPEKSQATYSSPGKCFDQISFDLVANSPTDYDLKVTLTDKKSISCQETMLFANTEIFHLETFVKAGKHVLNFKLSEGDMKTDFDFGGIKAYVFCEGVVDTVKSILRTLEAFVGGVSDHPSIPIIGSHVPHYMEQTNVEFLREAMEVEMPERVITDVEVDEDLIGSGDVLTIMRLDGVDPIVMWGTGSMGGHQTMALRFDGELYVIESQDAWYWPTAGLQRTPWKKWIQQAKEASFHVVWLPLSEQSKQKFDEKAANQWFFDTEGLPYGFHNMLYGWIDTPRDNLPPLLPNETVAILFSLLEKVVPEKISNFFSAGLNKRLGTEGLGITELAAVAAKRGMELQDVMAMPEQDGWVYSGETPRDGLSYVCSAYVASMFKAAGMFDDLEVNATEFIPKDVYRLDFFDKDYKRPQACIDADPDLPYCQLTGNYRMILTEYSSMQPYAHMADACPTVAPLYLHPEGC